MPSTPNHPDRSLLLRQLELQAERFQLARTNAVRALRVDLNPETWIRRYPLQSVVILLGIAFLRMRAVRGLDERPAASRSRRAA